MVSSEQAGRKVLIYSYGQFENADESELFREQNTEPGLASLDGYYKDEGCEFAVSCLNCLFPECVYDHPGGKRRWMREVRDRKIVQLFTMGNGINELAEKFRVSRRTIQRALGRNNNE